MTVPNCLRNVNVCEENTDPRSLATRATHRRVLSAEPPVPVPCPLDQNQVVIQPTTTVSGTQRIFCFCFDNQLC